MSDVKVLRLDTGKANSMTTAALDEIKRLVDGVRGPTVLTGTGRVFSAGLALPAIVDFDRPTMKKFIAHFEDVMMHVFQCPHPIIAAVNGHAIAGGCVLALQCDYRIMTDGDGTIGLTEAQLGIGLPAIVLETLRVAVTPGSLVPIAYAGRVFSPHEAAELGLVDEVATDAEERALARATELASLPAAALVQIKHALRAPVIERVRAIAEREREAWLDTWFAPEGQKRVRAAVARLKR